jgi:aminopeptidase 2
MSTKGRAQLTDRERVGFVQDMGALLDAGMLHGDDYMRTLSNFGDDASPEVVDATLSGINAVRVVFITKDLEDPWARYIRTTLRPALSRIGDAKKPEENLITTSLRGKLIATIGDYGKDPDLRKKGLELTKAYLANPGSVDPALVGPALRLAAIQGDATTYADFRKRFETSTSPPERERFLGTLGFFRDPKLVDQTLQYTIEGPLRPQEIFTVTQSMDTNEQRDQIWAFVQKNYSPLSQRIPPVYRVYLVYSAFGCTKDRIAEAKAFFTGDRAPFGTDVEMARMNDEINTCVSLREREGPRVAKMLTETATASK